MSTHDVEGEKMMGKDFIALVTAGLVCRFVDVSLGTGLRGD